MARRTTEGYIALHKKILDWEFFKDSNTFHVFMWILLNANYADGTVGIYKVKRGEVLTTYGQIASETGLTYDKVRTAISHLKIPRTITIKKHPKNIVISVVSYDRYQIKSQAKSQTRTQHNNKYNNSYEGSKTPSQEEKKKKEVFIEQ